jgi:hypothetical protein
MAVKIAIASEKHQLLYDQSPNQYETLLVVGLAHPPNNQAINVISSNET